MGNIRVEVCYLRPDSQWLREIDLPDGSSLQVAIEKSGLLRELEDIDLTAVRVGIYGKLKTLETTLRDRDRVEIYRPLIADPKESRRRRAVKKDERKSR